MRRILSPMFWIILTGSAAVAEPLKVTADVLKDLVDTKNTEVHAARKELSAAESRSGSLVRSFVPSVEVFAAQESLQMGRDERKTQPAYGAELKVNLLNGGQDLLTNESRHLDVRRRGFEVKKRISSELFEARQLYWQIKFLMEQKRLLEGTTELNKGNLAGAHRRVKSGIATGTDRVEFEMKDVDLRREQDQVKIRIERALRQLRVYMGVTADQALEFPEAYAHDHNYEKELKHSAEDSKFLFEGDLLSAEQTALQAKSSRREWLPKLDAYAAYNQYNEREKEFPTAEERTESVVGLRVTMGLGRGLESVKEAQALESEATAARLTAERRRLETENSIKSDFAELKSLHDQVHEAEENIERAQSYYKMTQSEYSRGVKNSPDVLGAAEKLFDRQIKRLEIVRDFQVARAKILSQTGR